MRLLTDGNVKPYYLQMVVMLFFQGIKFPEDGSDDDGLFAYITADADDGKVSSFAYVSDHGKADSFSFSMKRLFPGNRKKDCEICSGRALLGALERLTGHRPPWGILTGVRPARIVERLLSEGKTREEISSYFRDILCVTDRKFSAAYDSAIVARDLHTEDPEKECSIYIAVPFCPTRCRYCSFVSYTSPGLLALIPEYIGRLCFDITDMAALIKQLGLEVKSIYIGGGTPTVLDSTTLDRLLSVIEKEFGRTGEFTLEAGRPDTIDADKVSVAVSHGVTRMNVNPQTLNDDILRNIGRSHTTEDFYRAYETVAGRVRDINVDLIAGLPGDTLDNFRRSLDGVISLSPSNITVHAFSVKRSADFKKEGAYGRDDLTAMESVGYSQDKLDYEGYSPYYLYRQKNTVGNLENVGYARDGRICLYNVYMMEEIHSVFACGASSVTRLVGKDETGKQRISRFFEPKYPYEYLSPEKNDHNKRMSEIRDFFER